jgi:cytochrome P450
MKIVSKTLFDADVESEVAEISDAVTTALTVVGERTESLFPPPDWFPTASNRAIKRAMVTLNRIIQRFIEDRRASGEDRGDLLSMLLAAQDDEGVGMTDKQVRDEAMTLFGAGHETTAIALTWALYLISQHPEVEARLHEEVDRALGNRSATLNDLPNLPYTEMIAKEAMRLYPPAWGTTRELIGDITIGDYTIKKDNFIMMSFHALHHDPRIFDQPDRFDPERFSPENEKTIPKYAYLPFGAGPRVCIGNMFAMMEIRLVLATIAQQFRLTHDPSHAIIPDPVFTLRPRDGMPMTLSKREPLTVPTSVLDSGVAVKG